MLSHDQVGSLNASIHKQCYADANKTLDTIYCCIQAAYALPVCTRCYLSLDHVENLACNVLPILPCIVARLIDLISKGTNANARAIAPLARVDVELIFYAPSSGHAGHPR